MDTAITAILFLVAAELSAVDLIDDRERMMMEDDGSMTPIGSPKAIIKLTARGH